MLCCLDYITELRDSKLKTEGFMKQQIYKNFKIILYSSKF